MDRKGITAVALAIAVLVLWQIDNTKRTAALRAEQQKAEELAKLNAPAAPAATPAAPGTPVEPAVAEKIETVNTPSVDYSFTNLGGGIQRAVLTTHQAELESNVVMNQFGPTPIGALSEKGSAETVQPYTREAGGNADQVTFVRTDAHQVQIRKSYTLPKTETATRDPYLAYLEITFTNLGQQPVTYPAYQVYTGSAGPIHQLDQAQYVGYGWKPGGKFLFKQSGAFVKGGVLGFGKEQTPIYEESRPDVSWAAVTNQYFVSILTPLETQGIGAWARKSEIERSRVGDTATNPAPAPDAPKMPTVEGALVMPSFTVEPGKSHVQKFELYTGPREYQRLKALGHNEDDIMDFGTYIQYVSKPLLNSMNWLHSKFHSYAAAIIVLTIIIRGLMWPLQNKATQSMKKMQALNPIMTELKTKYKDDPARQNTELMKLYKEYQINPLAGCLPMFIQIPVFFGFFSMLGKAVELRHARFLWIHDLSQMDTVAMIPLFNWPLNILPLFMAATMLWQMSLSPKSGDAVQQRMFMFMPVIMMFFCYKYASALALYWTTSNIVSIVQLYLTRNQTAPVLQKVIPPSKKKR